MKRIAFLLIICPVFLAACATTKWDRTNVAKDYYYVVTLEQSQGKNGLILKDYRHPYAMNVSDLERLMGELTFTDRAGLMTEKKQSPIFQPDEIARLAPVLSESLAKADASQRVRFVSFNQVKGLIFATSKKTEGVLFVDTDGRLNFAFNYIDVDRQPSETSAIYHVFSSVDPVKIDTSDTTVSPIAPYVEPHQFFTGGEAPMWVVVDLEKMKESIGAAPVPVVKEPETVTPAVAPKTETVSPPVETAAPAPVVKVPEAASPAVAPKTETVSPPIEKTAPAPIVQKPETAIPAVVPKTEAVSPAVEKAVPAPTSDQLLERDIKNKLKYLKGLLDEGLISEQDYANKKAQLLEKIK